MRALLVMDMQEKVLGKNRDKKYSYESNELINNINKEINKFDKENVFYIKTINKKNLINKVLSKNLYENMPESKLVNNLSIVNKMFIEKESNNVFKNKTFDERLKKAKIDELQIVGIDTCGSILDSVLSGVKKGYKIIINKNLTATIKKEKIEKIYKKMQDKGVKILN